MRFDEENYEDELDRMRARSQRKKSGRVPAPREVDDDDDFLFYDDVDEIGSDRDDIIDEDDDDFEDYNFDYEDDDDGVEEPAFVRSVKAGRYASKKRPKSGRQSLENRSKGGGQDPENSRPAARQPGSPKKRRKKSGFLKVLLFVAVLLAGYLLYQRVTDDGYWTVAVFGVDSRDGKLGKGALSDVEMICSINKKTGEMRLVSVFRDSYLRIDNEDNYHKINEAYFKGGHQQAVEALEQNLDIHIDDYATFNWKAVVDAINVLGGVDIEITDREFAYINGFITETVNSTGVGSYQLEHSGMNHLDGVQAVAYARLRLMDTDFNRTERQRKVLSLAIEKAKAADFNTLKTLIGTVFPQVSTSIGVDDLVVMAKDARKYYIGQTSGFPFSHTEMKIGKLDCVIPTTLESNVVKLHSFLYDDDSYVPSGMVKKISSHISEKSGIGEPGDDIESNRTNGGKSSDSSGGSQKQTAAGPVPQETAPPETLPPETESTEESTGESAGETSEGEPEEMTTIAPIEESTGEEVTKEQEQGPGTVTTEAPAPTEPVTTQAATRPEEPQATNGALEGPGQGGSSQETAGPGVS